MLEHDLLVYLALILNLILLVVFFVHVNRYNHWKAEYEKLIISRNATHEAQIKELTNKFGGYLKLLDERLDERYEQIADKIAVMVSKRLIKRERVIS